MRAATTEQTPPQRTASRRLLPAAASRRAGPSCTRAIGSPTRTPRGSRASRSSIATFAEWVDAHGGAGDGRRRACRRHGGAFMPDDFAGAIAAGGKLGALGATVANKAAAIYSLQARRRRSAVGCWAPPSHAANAASSCCPISPMRTTCWRSRSADTVSESRSSRPLRTASRPAFARISSHAAARAEARRGPHCPRLVSRGDRREDRLAARRRSPIRRRAKPPMEHFRQRRQARPGSPIAQIEYANGLLLLDAKSTANQADELYARGGRLRAGRCDGAARCRARATLPALTAIGRAAPSATAAQSASEPPPSNTR